jgi:hypothetical protein
MLIIKRFSCVVPSWTRQSYKDFELVQRMSGRLTYRILSSVDLITVPMLKPYTILYNFKVNILLVTLLHLIED